MSNTQVQFAGNYDIERQIALLGQLAAAAARNDSFCLAVPPCVFSNRDKLPEDVVSMVTQPLLFDEGIRAICSEIQPVSSAGTFDPRLPPHIGNATAASSFVAGFAAVLSAI